MFDTQKALETAERIYRKKEAEKVEDEPMTKEESKRLAEKEKKAKKEELEKKFNEIQAAQANFNREFAFDTTPQIELNTKILPKRGIIIWKM